MLPEIRRPESCLRTDKWDAKDLYNRHREGRFADRWSRSNHRKRQAMQNVVKMGPLCTRAYSFPQTTSKLSIHPMFTFLWVLWWLSDRNSVMNGDEEQETTGYTDWGDELIHNWQAHAYLPWSCVCLCYWLKNISRAPGNRLEWCFVTDCTQTSAYLTYRGVGGYVIKL